MLAEEGLFATIDAVGLRRVAPARAKVHGRGTDHLTPEQHARHAIERLGPTFIKVGQAVERMLRRASSGEIRVSIRPTGFESIIADLHELVNRLAFALIVAALVIGFSSLLSTTRAPAWVQRVGEIGLVAAFLVSFWFFGSIILSHYRERKR